MEETIQIKPKNSESRWVALDVNNNIISEGVQPEKVREDAKKISDVYFLLFIPEKGVTYFL